MGGCGPHVVQCWHGPRESQLNDSKATIVNSPSNYMDNLAGEFYFLLFSHRATSSGEVVKETRFTGTERPGLVVYVYVHLEEGLGVCPGPQYGCAQGGM